MKKTIQINLNGLAFQIEDDAFEILKKYLEQIENLFKNRNEATEIIADIESRMAELFKYGQSENQITITLLQVEEIIKTIGKPEDFKTELEGEEETENSSKKTEAQQPPHTAPTSKRLYRNIDKRVIGGVCSGLGAYFNIDPLVFRVIFILSLWFGFPVLLYLLLWIIIPAAMTFNQKLEMNGPGTTLSDFEQNIKSEYNEVSHKFKNMKNTKGYQRMEDGIQQTGDYMSIALRKFIRIISGLIGFAISITGFAALVSLVFFITFSKSFHHGGFFDEAYWATLPERFLPNIDITLFSIAVLIIAGIPLLTLFYLGLKIIFRFKGEGAVLGLSFLGIWIVGIILLAYTASHSISTFSQGYENQETIVLQPTRANTIYLEAHPDFRYDQERKHLFDIYDLKAYAHNNKIDVEGRPRIEIEKGNQFKLTVEKSSRGKDSETANANSFFTTYKWEQLDSILFLDRIFTIEQEGLIRNQKVKITLEVPTDKEVNIAPELTWYVND